MVTVPSPEDGGWPLPPLHWNATLTVLAPTRSTFACSLPGRGWSMSTSCLRHADAHHMPAAGRHAHALPGHHLLHLLAARAACWPGISASGHGGFHLAALALHGAAAPQAGAQLGGLQRLQWQNAWPPGPGSRCDAHGWLSFRGKAAHCSAATGAQHRMTGTSQQARRPHAPTTCVTGCTRASGPPYLRPPASPSSGTLNTAASAPNPAQWPAGWPSPPSSPCWPGTTG
jgi:hypothetical protein